MSLTMEKDPTFSSWIIICTKHGSSCPQSKGVKPKGKSLKGDAHPARYKGKPAFYFKYNGGLREKHMKLHYPEDLDHGFQVIPVPKGIKTITIDGVYVVDEARLDQPRPKKLARFSKKKQEKSNDIVFQAISREKSQNNLYLEETQDVTPQREDSDYEEREDYISKNPKKLRTEEPKDFEILDYKENNDSTKREEDKEVSIILNEVHPQKKLTKLKPLSEQDADFYLKQKRKPRKCKKLREVDPVEQCKGTIKFLFKEVKGIRGTLLGLQEEQFATSQTLFGLCQATKDIRNQADQIISELSQARKQEPSVTQRIIINKSSTESKGKTFPELANI